MAQAAKLKGRPASVEAGAGACRVLRSLFVAALFAIIATAGSSRPALAKYAAIVVDADTGAATGVASYLRIQPEMGVIEVGHIAWSPILQQTRAATEAMYLLMKHVFDGLGFRRYEWKCDALNAASRRAAARLGFSFEGIVRQATVYKGRNRDTAWYSVIDTEWPAIRTEFESWLAPANFDSEGRQQESLTVPTRS